jgi:hypothetical protein
MMLMQNLMQRYKRKQFESKMMEGTFFSCVSLPPTDWAGPVLPLGSTVKAHAHWCWSPVSCLSPAHKKDRPHGFWEIGSKRFAGSWKCETPFGLEADILRHLGRCTGQMESELEPTLHKWEFCFLLLLSFWGVQAASQMGLYVHIYMTASCTCGFSLDSQQVTFCTFCFLCHSPQYHAHWAQMLAGPSKSKDCKGAE